jgi:N6-adenosine-specific RNA methylase IME4
LRATAEALWKDGKDATIKAVLGEQKQAEIKKQRAEFEQRRERGGAVDDLTALAASGKRFPVIYADPPWEFQVYSGKGKQRSAERYYDTSSLDGIKAIPVAPLAADDCALFLWAVCPEQPGAVAVMQAWGFEYKTVAFFWVKTTKNAERIELDGDGLHWGMGYWTRANIEPVLLGTKGSPQRMDKDVHQVVIAPVGEHSEKPEEVRRRIERLLLGPYLELFARRQAPGWTVWGNEIAPYDANADFAGSLDQAVSARVAAGGKRWEPR